MPSTPEGREPNQSPCRLIFVTGVIAVIMMLSLRKPSQLMTQFFRYLVSVSKPLKWVLPGLLVTLTITLTWIAATTTWAQTQPPPFSAQAQQAQGNQDIGPENILLILDASESMKENIEPGVSKMVAAKRVILQTIQKVPPQNPIGLRVYGTETHNACRSSRLVVPIAPNNRFKIASSLTKIHPTGMTPISYALQAALASDFMNLPGRKSIILVSDGLETCGADPCDVAVNMVRNRADVKINVIGYGLKNLDGIKQLKCVALATKAKFVNATTSAELANGLDNLVGARKEVQAQIILPGQQPRPIQF